MYKAIKSLCLQNYSLGKFETKTNRPPGGATLSIDLTRRPAATLNRSNLTADRERRMSNSAMTSSTLGSRKTVRFADDSPCQSGSTTRPVSGEYLRLPVSEIGDRSGSPSRLTPPRLGMPNQQLTSFISVGDSTGSPVWTLKTTWIVQNFCTSWYHWCDCDYYRVWIARVGRNLCTWNLTCICSKMLPLKMFLAGLCLNTQQFKTVNKYNNCTHYRSLLHWCNWGLNEFWWASIKWLRSSTI